MKLFGFRINSGEIKDVREIEKTLESIQMNILAPDTTNMILQMVQDLLQKNMIGTLFTASGYQIIQNHITCI